MTKEDIIARITPTPGPLATPCWIWNRSLNKKGYGNAFHRGQMRLSHAVSFEVFKGEMPDGKEHDHECNVRACANPDHIRPLTHAENVARSRKTECQYGHEFTAENTAHLSGKQAGQRRCKTCRDEYRAAYYLAHKSP